YAAGNVTVWYKDHRGPTVERALRRASSFADGSQNGGVENFTVRLASGTIGLLGALNDTIGRLETLTVILISLVIFAVTTFIYRSFTAGLLLAMISNTAYLITSAIMYHLEIGLDVNTLPIGAVGMGIGIDYNIYLMSRMCEEYRINPDYSKLIPASIFTTGKAIFFTATTMVVGIILWYFMSSLRFQAEMGLLLSAVMMEHVIYAIFANEFYSEGIVFRAPPLIIANEEISAGNGAMESLPTNGRWTMRRGKFLSSMLLIFFAVAIRSTAWGQFNVGPFEITGFY